MLRLKRVELQGFKSFCDRTEMKFNGSGIAAVVGPNGCGKSNLSDAISWVLGEQSAKSLRGARMEDVIFAGTGERKALGMASVTMTLIPDESVAVDSRGEVTITRRLYRSGDSEYLINGKLARLRDIQELFLGTGLGPESYAIIEQGRIGQILSSKPQDRRNVIEEAAGITKFKTRKRLAEAKLESAKQNLARVFDILEEVSRQVNSLKRQAAKTRRYEELRTEAQGYLRSILRDKFVALERHVAQCMLELNLQQSALQAAQGELESAENRKAAASEQYTAVEQALTDARSRMAALRLEAERARGTLEFQVRQLKQIGERLGQGRHESELLGQQVAERTAELEEQGREQAALAAELDGQRTSLETCGAERQQAHAHLAAAEASGETQRQALMRLMNEAGGRKNRIAQAEAQLANADRDESRAGAEEAQALADLERVQRQRKELGERLEARQMELVSLSDQRKAVEAELQGARASATETRQAIDRLRSEHGRIKARHDSLQEIIQHRSYTAEAVKRLFTAVEKGRARGLQPVGVLADHLEITDTGLEKVTEEFLHDELEYVVVRDWSDGERGIELMRTELEGRGTFFVEQTGESEREASHGGEAKPAPDGTTRLVDVLRLTNGLGNVPMTYRIRHAYVASDAQTARQLAPQYPDFWFLTPEGLQFHGHTVAGGKKSTVGPLGLKREVRELAGQELEKQKELESAGVRMAELEKALSRLGEQLEHLRNKQQAQEKDALALDHESRKSGEDLQRIQARLSKARLDLEHLGRESVRLGAALQQDSEALAHVEQQRAEQEGALHAVRESLSGLRSTVQQLNEEHGRLRSVVSGLEERVRAAANLQTRLENQIGELQGRRDGLANEAALLLEQRQGLEESNHSLAQEETRLAAEIGRHDTQIMELAEQEVAGRAQLAAIEGEMRAIRTRIGEVSEKRLELEVASARASSDMEHLNATSQTELGMAAAEIPEEEAGVDRAQLQTRYDELRRRIEALGPVNPQALEELAEAEQRQDFLQTQREDLLNSIRDTEKAISEIDTESKKRFGEAFTAINANFREMFKVLFGGGMGEMRLTDEENLADSGIDIVASPPGKRLQSVLLLSGGEKSLTAMALLMAVFQYTPSPFCVLDEVDAPLDEPNTERLTRLLREMANQTQFIVITHSKRTMEAAQALYGVTMQEPGVSKLVSVRFKESGEKAQAAAANQSELVTA